MQIKRRNLQFGLITSKHKLPVWPVFVDRFGDLLWSYEDDLLNKQHQGSATTPRTLSHLCESQAPNVILVDHVRLNHKSPVWKTAEVQVVVSTSQWRSTPTNEDWLTSSTLLDHADLGGVTNGTFRIYMAWRRAMKAPEFDTAPSVPALLNHVIDPTLPGRVGPTAQGVPLGCDENGRLLWRRRFTKIHLPTVFAKGKRVRRRLSPKELVSVLDLPNI